MTILRLLIYHALPAKYLAKLNARQLAGIDEPGPIALYLQTAVIHRMIFLAPEHVESDKAIMPNHQGETIGCNRALIGES